MEEKKERYELLDLAGNVEAETLMTNLEAKLANEKLLAGERFLKWVKKNA